MRVKIKQGTVIGKKENTFPRGKTYYSFFGIPYAKPPLGSLRFQAPRPHSGWSGVLDATVPRSACLQKALLHAPEGQFGSEDCLFVNVHVPESHQQGKLIPVMVWVHGGGFHLGYGDAYGADYLMEYDVILVTFNYRINVFGFLNLGLPECPGNVGLKDQILLFKWVRENILSFGGDPNNVTAFGHSAGAASIHYLMISPICKGLFDRAILQSGWAICNWTTANNPTRDAFELGAILGFKRGNKKELLDFLLKVPAQVLCRASTKMLYRFMSGHYSTDMIFSPSVEYAVDEHAAVLPNRPEILMEAAVPIPILTGIADNEWIIFNIYISNTLKSEYPLNFGNKIRQFYNIGKTADNKILSEIQSDITFGFPLYKTCEHILNRNPNVPIYIYRFSYKGSLNPSKWLTSLYLDNMQQFTETSHGDELPYLFRINDFFKVPLQGNDLSLERNELSMINTMCTLWTNFAKYGKPLPSDFESNWQRTTAKDPCYLQIDENNALKRGIIREQQMKYLDCIKDNAGFPVQLLNSRFKL